MVVPASVLVIFIFSLILILDKQSEPSSTANPLCQTKITTENVPFRVLQNASEPIRLEFTADWDTAHELYMYFDRVNGSHAYHMYRKFNLLFFKALHGEVSKFMYIWFAVTPCVYLLAR